MTRVYKTRAERDALRLQRRINADAVQRAVEKAEVELRRIRAEKNATQKLGGKYRLTWNGKLVNIAGRQSIEV